MATILYTLMILSCMGSTLLRGGKNETQIKIQGEVCGNYWIEGEEYNSFSQI